MPMAVLARAADRRAMGQRRQRQHAAFAIIVGAHDEDDIFDRHHDHQRPEDQRQRAIDGRRRRAAAPPAASADLAHGIKRAGADIAEHDAQRAAMVRPRSRRLMTGACVCRRWLMRF